jgi:hypothetical protein
MKAEYIIAALLAMKTTEDRLCSFEKMEAKERWKLGLDLMNARIDLLCYSGIKEQDVTIEE